MTFPPETGPLEVRVSGVGNAASELVQIGERMLLYALITAYGRSHAYTFDRTQGDLYLVTGPG